MQPLRLYLFLKRLLSPRLTVSLTSFSSPDYLPITWALVPCIRVQGVDRCLCLLLFFFSLIIRPLFAILSSICFWCTYARSYFYHIVRDLISRSTRLTFRPLPRPAPPFRVFPSLSQVSRKFPPLIDRREGSRVSII